MILLEGLRKIKRIMKKYKIRNRINRGFATKCSRKIKKVEKSC